MGNRRACRAALPWLAFLLFHEAHSFRNPPAPSPSGLSISLEAHPDSGRAAIQTALDSLRAAGGGTLIMGAGDFAFPNHSGPVTCDSCRDIRVIGAGHATVIRGASETGGADCVESFFLFRHSVGITFSGLRFEGLRLPKDAWGNNLKYHAAIRFADSRNARIDSCSFGGFFTGAAVFQATRGISVTSCRFDSVAYRIKGGDYGAISIEAGSGSGYIARNIFTNLTHSAISAYAADSLEILGNRAGFDSNSGFTMGVFAPAGLRHSVISRNRIVGARNEAITLASGSEAVFGNRIEHNVLQARYAGVALNQPTFGCDQLPAFDNVILGNAISGTGADTVQHAILLNRSARTRISGNEIRGYRWAISVHYCSSGSITEGNSLR